MTLLFVALILVFVVPEGRVPTGPILALAALAGALAPFAMVRWQVPATARRIYAQQHDLRG